MRISTEPLSWLGTEWVSTGTAETLSHPESCPCPHEDSHGTQLGCPIGAELDSGALHHQPHPHILSKVQRGFIHLQFMDVNPAQHRQIVLVAVAQRGMGTGTGTPQGGSYRGTA